MQINRPGHVHGPQSVNAPHRNQTQQPQTPTNSNLTEVDQLDISTEASMVSRARDLPEIRQDVVNRVKAEIEAGKYETDEKLDIALGRMLDEFGE